MLVMKFGGTSLGDVAALSRTTQIAADADKPLAIVVSAMGKTTDQLLEAGTKAEGGDRDGATQLVDRIRALHAEAAGQDGALGERVDALLRELTSVLEGVRLLREQTSRSRALLTSFGERLCAEVFAAKLSEQGKPAQAVDARSLIITDERYESASVRAEETARRTREGLRPLIDKGVTPVVTGFIASTPSGVTSTLGRSGSDYTATLVGAALGAEEIIIYTDVDGILSADPRLVKEARSLERVSYREAAEMSYFGARVLHPRTIVPASEAKIPVRVRSSFAPERPGTLIAESAPTLPLGVKTVSSIHRQALVTIDGRGMAGIPGVARRVFEASELADVNVAMISQASSEQTISLVVPDHESERLVNALKERFSPELASGAIERIVDEHGIAVVSIIGRGMTGTPGISGRFFGALGQAQVNVLAIAQGGSELSISAAIKEAEARRAVRASHTAFGLTRILNIMLVGCGRVGGTFVRLLAETRKRMEEQLDLQLRLIGVATDVTTVLDYDGIAPEEVEARLAEGQPYLNQEELIEHLVEQRFTDLVVVDATAAPMAKLHLAALKSRFHVVTANKIPMSGPLESYRELQNVSRVLGVRYNYETTFGAGLPVLHALQELVHTGDRPMRVSGCLSGTLGFICTCLDDGMPLSEAVAEADRKGFTEPDPREDLSGRDVARKALIIARACGLEIEADQVELEAVVPDLERGLGPAIETFEPQLNKRVAEAKEKGEVLRYVADIRPDAVRVGLQAVPAAGPIGSLRGPDNIVVFQTERYNDYPLVIRGPGAGAEVTAAGVLGDVLKIAGPAPASSDFSMDGTS